MWHRSPLLLSIHVARTHRCERLFTEFCHNRKSKAQLFAWTISKITNYRNCQRNLQLSPLCLSAHHFSSSFTRTVTTRSSLSNWQPSLFTMKLDTPQFKALFTSEFQRLIQLFEKYNYELRIAGGAVRDLLMHKDCHDVDFATTATPDEMKNMFEAEQIRMINMKGEKHGTITCRINDKENFEVTTLRIDVVTDGRHAEVEFTRDWQLDALRRDLTINSMFLGTDGTLYDFYNGYDDLQNKKVKFVGDAASRIQEDYLRILRYFRFFGRISSNPEAHEPGILSTIKENIDGLSRISGERIWVEIKKILTGRFVGSIMCDMIDVGMAKHIGLPENVNKDEFRKVYSRGQNLETKPTTLLAALLHDEAQMYEVNKRLKMSREEVELGLFIINHRNTDFQPDPLRHCQDMACDLTGGAKTKDRICELLKYVGDSRTLEKFSQWTLPKLPVNGVSLMKRGVQKGPKLAIALKLLREEWKKSNYTLTEEELLDLIPKLKL